MGISLQMIETMQGLRLFGKGRISVLDIGSSNLYSASAEGVRNFLTTYGVATSPDLDAFAEKLAEGSAYDAVSGGLNGAFVGELLEKAGMRYNAIDIADGYGTTILDLNHEAAPPQFLGAFDLVLNFGTTEHLLNQYNAFKVIHDSTKVGGYMVHSLPCVGYSNHGYFTYTPRCMFDLAGYNEYELVDFRFEGPAGSNDLFAPVRDYLSYFPKLGNTLASRDSTESGQQVGGLYLPDVALMVIYRKVKARPFAGALERSTSVGAVPASVTSGYESGMMGALSRRVTRQHGATAVRFPWLPAALRGPARRLRDFVLRRASIRDVEATTATPTDNASGPLAPHVDISLTGKALELRDKFVSGKLDLDECLVFYKLVVEQNGFFPYDWEQRILLLGLEREPGRRDLADRLAIVKNYL